MDVKDFVDPFAGPVAPPSPPPVAVKGSSDGILDTFNDPFADPYEKKIQYPVTSPRKQSKIRAGLGKVKDLWTGDKTRQFELPSFANITADDIGAGAMTRIAFAYAVSPDPKAVSDVIEATLPGAKRSTDKFGNEMFSFKGQDYYVNPPGFDHTDMAQLFSQGAAYTPAARLAGRARTLPKRMGAAGGLMAGTSALLDIQAMAVGSKQGVSPMRAAVVGAGGFLFEGLTPAVIAGWQKIFGSRGGRFFDRKAGKLTDKGRAEAEKAGFDVNEMDQRLAQMFSEELDAALGGAEAAGVSQSARFNIPYTRAQTTQKHGQFQDEEALRHGAYGDDASQVVREFDQRQQQAMMGAAEGIQDDLVGGARTIERENQGGADRASIQAAYDEVGAATASISAENLSTLPGFVRQALDEADVVVDDVLTPATQRALKEAGDVVPSVPTKTKFLGTPHDIKRNIQEMERSRRRLNSIIGTAANATDRRGATIVKRAYDDWLDEAAEKALIEGDDAALEALKGARSIRRKYGEQFEAQDKRDAAGKIMEDIVLGDLTPEQIVNVLFGRAKLGAKLTSAHAAKRVKDIFGAKSEEFNTIRQMAWLRLTKGALGAEKDSFSPTKYSKDLVDALEGSGESLMKELFTEGEMALFREFSTAVKRTVTPATALQPSKTAFTVTRLARAFMRRVGQGATMSGDPVTGGVAFGIAKTPNWLAKRKAKNITKGMRPQWPREPLVPAMGAATVGQRD